MGSQEGAAGSGDEMAFALVGLALIGLAAALAFLEGRRGDAKKGQR